MRSCLAILLWALLGWGSTQAQAQAQPKPSKTTQTAKEQAAYDLMLEGDYAGATKLYREIVQNTKLPLEKRVYAQKQIVDISLFNLSRSRPKKENFSGLQDVKRELETLIALDPNGALAYADYGEVLLYLEDFEGAIDAYSASLALGNPKAAAPLANAYYRNKQLLEATEAYQIALQNDPSNEELWFRLGRSQFLLNHFAAAEVSLARAYALKPLNNYSTAYPSNYEITVLYSEALSKLGKFTEAIKIAEGLPGMAYNTHETIEAYLFIASLYADDNQPENADYYLNRAKSAAEKAKATGLLAKTLNNQAWYICTTQQKNLQTPERIQMAYDMAKKAVALSNRSRKEYLDTQAEAAYLLGQYEEAIELETEALAFDPTHPFYLGQLQKYKDALLESAPRGEPISD